MATIEKTYSEMLKFHSFEDRFRYLKLKGSVGHQTFGHNRYLNQKFYASKDWKRFRRDIIIRDNACDLGVDDGLHDISSKILIHHINPITMEDIALHRFDVLLNPENAICVSHNTHEAIHYSNESILYSYKERSLNDTQLWTPINEVRL